MLDNVGGAYRGTLLIPSGARSHPGDEGRVGALFLGPSCKRTPVEVVIPGDHDRLVQGLAIAPGDVGRQPVHGALGRRKNPQTP